MSIRFMQFCRCLITVSSLLAVFGMPTAAFSQISPEEHAAHHPEEAGANAGGSGTRGTAGPPEGAGPKNGMGGMMGGKGGGMMGGMMDGMMEKMGAPKPKDLYPSLRVAIISPSNGEKPMVVSTDCPP